MKKLNLFLIVFAFIFSGKIFAQGMMPPAPIESSLLNSMEGTWVSEPYQMMGMTFTDEVTQKMVLNSQFFEINVKSTSKGFNYEATIFMAPQKDGSMTGWCYDVFGKNGITTYTGTSEGNKIYLTGTSSMGIENRNITVEGNIMIHNVVYKMKSEDGKAMPDEVVAITYNKKM